MGRELDDPMRPAIMSRAPDTVPAKIYRDKWALESTIISGEQRMAIISGKSYRVGDSIGGALLVSIGRGSVIYEMQGHRFERDMKSELMKFNNNSLKTEHVEKGTP